MKYKHFRNQMDNLFGVTIVHSLNHPRIKSIKFYYNFDLTITIYMYKDGEVLYWIDDKQDSQECYQHTIYPNSTLDLDKFRNQINSGSMKRNKTMIDSKVLDHIVQTLNDCVNKTRSECAAFATIWVSNQIRREWNDLLPIVTDMIISN